MTSVPSVSRIVFFLVSVLILSRADCALVHDRTINLPPNFEALRPVISPDSRKLAVFCSRELPRADEVIVFDIATGSVLVRRPAVNFTMGRLDAALSNPVAFSQNSSQIFLPVATSEVASLDIRSGRKITSFFSKAKEFYSLSPYFDKNQKDERVFLVGDDRSAVFDSRSGRLIYEFPRVALSTMPEWWLGAVMPNGTLAAEARGDGYIRMWNLSNGKPVVRGAGFNFYNAPVPSPSGLGIFHAITHVSFDSKELRLIRYGEQSSEYLHVDPSSGRLTSSWTIYPDFHFMPGGMDLSSDGKQVLLGGSSKRAQGVRTNVCARRLVGANLNPWLLDFARGASLVDFTHVALAPNGKSFVTTGNGQTIEIWKIQ